MLIPIQKMHNLFMTSKQEPVIPGRFFWSSAPRTKCQAVEIVTDSTHTTLHLFLQSSTNIPTYWFSVCTELKPFHLTSILDCYTGKYREVNPIPQIQKLLLITFYCNSHLPSSRKRTQMIATVAFSSAV